MRTLLKVLVVLAVLLVGADRLTDHVAERAVASRIQQSEDLQTRPDVDITGFPFLTQLAAKRFGKVVVTAPAVQLGRERSSQRVRLRAVEVTLRDVRTTSSFQRFTAAGARATATVGYPELSRLTGLRVRYGGQGRVTASKRFDVGGQQLTPTFTIRPRLLDGVVDLTGELSKGTASLPPAVTTAIRDALGVRLPLTGLPFGVRPTSIAATSSGLRVRLVAGALSYP